MSKIQLHSIILIVLLGLALTGAKSVKPLPETGAASTDFKSIPLAIDGWEGIEKRFPEDTYKQLPLASLLLRYYEKEEAYAHVELTIVYGVDMGSFHQPEVCLEGQGLRRVKSRSVSLPDGKGGSFEAISMVMESDYGRSAFLYWFYSDGVYSTSLGNYKLTLFMHRLKRSRELKPSAMVRLSTRVMYSDEEAEERLVDFAKSAVPYLEKQISPSVDAGR